MLRTLDEIDLLKAQFPGQCAAAIICICLWPAVLAWAVSVPLKTNKILWLTTMALSFFMVIFGCRCSIELAELICLKREFCSTFDMPVPPNAATHAKSWPEVQRSLEEARLDFEKNRKTYENSMQELGTMPSKTAADIDAYIQYYREVVACREAAGHKLWVLEEMRIAAYYGGFHEVRSLPFDDHL